MKRRGRRGRISRGLGTDDAAETGIGTMIVFIAGVLVAAIAAGVLINTSGVLQQKSTRTGQEATQQVGGNLVVQSLVGTRDSTAQTSLQDLEIYLALAPGSDPMDLAQLKIQLQDSTRSVTLGWVNGAASATQFSVSAVRDQDSSFTAALPTVNSGDLVKVQVDLALTLQTLDPREDMTIVLLPEKGGSLTTGFNVPTSFGTKTVVKLI